MRGLTSLKSEIWKEGDSIGLRIVTIVVVILCIPLAIVGGLTTVVAIVGGLVAIIVVVLVAIIPVVIIYSILVTILGAIIQPNDTTMFGASSLISVSVDPLFLYIPLIEEHTKCLMLDKRVMKAALILRIITDLPYISRIRFNFKNRRLLGSHEKLAMTIANDIAAILPIPQVIILVFLPEMRGYRSLSVIKFLNSLILLQYLPRVYPIYHWCKSFNKKTRDPTTQIIARDDTLPWLNLNSAPIIVNFFLYIIASYVLGTFWYFFSIQREMDCWGYACRRENGCEFSTRCKDNAFRNITLLKDLCPINPPDATVFDFGIFTYALQSGMQESTNFPQKFLQCFSFGLRNLSSFASNLNSSTYGWETLFVVFISMSGLLLFIYLLGHVQTFMQTVDGSARSLQNYKRIKPKIRDMLVSEYGLPNDVELRIQSVVYTELQELDADLVVENMFSIFSFNSMARNRLVLDELLNEIRCSLFLEKLKKVPKRKDMDEDVLKEICHHLDPVIYPNGSYIIREGEPLDMMFFITQGIVLTYTTDDHSHGRRTSTGGSSTTTRLEKGDCYGEELLSWAETSATSFSNLPNSTRTVKSHKKVELFAFQAADLQSILSKFPGHFSELPHSADSTPHMEIAVHNS